MAPLATAFVRVRPDTTTFRPELQRGLRTSERDADSEGSRSGGVFGRAFSARARAGVSGSGRLFAGMSTSLKGFIPIAGAAGIAAAGFGLKSAASIEQSQVAFATLLHSGQKAQTFIAQLQKFAAATPFDFPGVVDASRQLLGVGQSAKSVIPTLTAFGDASGALGLSQDQFQHIMLATTQAMANGKLQAGDLLQITEAGLPVWKLLSQALGLPVAKVRELSSHGKLLTDDVLPKLQKVMEKDYGGAMARQSQTLTGLWSTFTDTVQQGLAKALMPLVPIIEHALPRAMNGLSKAFSVGGQAISDFVHGFTIGTDGPNDPQTRMAMFGAVAYENFQKIQGVIRSVMPTVMTFAASVIHLGRTLLPLLSTLKPLAALIAGGLLIGLRGASAALNFLARGGTATRAVVVGLTSAFLLWKGAQVAVAAATRTMAAVQAVLNVVMTANPIGIVVVALAGLAAGLVYAYRNSETFRRIVQAAFHGVGTAVKVVAHFFTGPFLQAVGTYVKVSVTAFRFLANVWFTVVGGIVRGAADAFGWVPGVGGKLKAASRAFDTFHHDVDAKLSAVASDAGGWGTTIGGNLSAGLSSGILAGFQTHVIRAVTHMADGTVKISTAKWEMASPSKLFHRIGRDGIGQGLANGILAGRQKAVAAAKALAQAVTDQIATLRGDKSQLATSIRDSISGGAALTNTPNQTVGGITTFLTGQLSADRAFRAGLKTLSSKGLSAALVSQLGQSGPDQAGNIVRQLSGASRSQLATITHLQRQIDQTAAATGGQTASTVYDPQIAALIKEQRATTKAVQRVAADLAHLQATGHHQTKVKPSRG